MTEAPADRWAADLAEARRRTDEHLERRHAAVLEMPPPEVYMPSPGVAPSVPSEEAHAEAQPTAAVVVMVLCVFVAVSAAAIFVSLRPDLAHAALLKVWPR